MSRLPALAALLALGCALDTGQEAIVIPLELHGAATTVVEGRDGWTVELTEARLAFGPLYLCAGLTAGDLCETARGEWLDAAVVDALDPTPVEVGSLVGVSGSVRSYMYDLGRTSVLTAEEPLVLGAAEALGGRSVRLTGVARRGGTSLPFSASIVVEQGPDVERGVPVVRSADGAGFEHELGGRDRLVVGFDPAAWLASASFNSALEDRRCAPDGPEVVCAGGIEQRCAPHGSLTSQRACPALCLRDVGCAERLEVAPNSPIGRAIRNDVAVGRRPTFRFLEDP